MKKKLDSVCIDCIISKRLSDYPEKADEKLKREYKRRALNLILTTDENGGAPLISREILLLKEKLFKLKQDFSELNREFNDKMLNIEREISEKIVNSPDAFISATKYSLAGNYIDVSTVSSLNENELFDILNKSSTFNLPKSEINNLKNDLSSAKNLAYVCDNCGEIVLDKLFIKTIKTLYPNLNITAIVRGKPVANDATEKDALYVGLDKVCRVYGNGTDIAGTYFKEINRNVKKIIKNADVIISKGQGNYETLSSCKLNVYYLFLCKCDMFLKKFGVPLFTPLIINEKRQ